MDPLSVSASIVALLQATQVVYGYARDVIKAPAEQRELAEVVNQQLEQLQRLKIREDDARQDPDAPWYQGLRALTKSAAPAPSGGGMLVPDPTGTGDGVLVRLRKAMDKTMADLARQRGCKRIRQRWLWSHDKSKFVGLIEQFKEWRSQIDSVLHQDHFALSLSIRTLGLDTNTRVQNIEEVDIDTNIRVKSLVEKADRLAIIKWLSPLEFRRRQTEIIDGCFLVTHSLLKSQVFEAWVVGRPWMLHCYGILGAGKVRVWFSESMIYLPEGLILLDDAVIDGRTTASERCREETE